MDYNRFLKDRIRKTNNTWLVHRLKTFRPNGMDQKKKINKKNRIPQTSFVGVTVQKLQDIFLTIDAQKLICL